MDKQMRILWASLLLALFILVPGGSHAVADDTDNNVWHVKNAFGSVWLVVGGVEHASLAQTSTLKPGDSIRTGQNGRALLVHGEEFILVAPNSAIEIGKDETQGLSTKIIQRAGSIVLEVEKRNVKHFEVDTPLLAALVKGTRFRVTVAKDDASVDVLRGQVEVSDFKTGQYALVNSEQSAKVMAQGPAGLSLRGSGTLSPIQQGSPRRSPVDFAPIGIERRATADDPSQLNSPNEAASSQHKAETIPSALATRTAKTSLRHSLSASLVPPAEADSALPAAAPNEQRIVVASPLNDGISSGAVRWGIGGITESLESDDDNLRLVPWVVGVAVMVSFAVTIRRRWKRRRQ